MEKMNNWENKGTDEIKDKEEVNNEGTKYIVMPDGTVSTQVTPEEYNEQLKDR